MKVIADDNKSNVYNLFPHLDCIGGPGYDKDVWKEIYTTYYVCKLSVLDRKFGDIPCEEVDVLNLNSRLVPMYQAAVSDRVNMGLVDSLANWNAKLENFYRALVRQYEVIAFVEDTEEECLYFYSFETLEELDREIRNTINNKYISPVEQDWPKEVLYRRAHGIREFTSQMISRHSKLYLVIPSAKCILVGVRDKTIWLYCVADRNKTICDLAVGAGLFVSSRECETP